MHCRFNSHGNRWYRVGTVSFVFMHMKVLFLWCPILSRNQRKDICYRFGLLFLFIILKSLCKSLNYIPQLALFAIISPVVSSEKLAMNVGIRLPCSIYLFSSSSKDP